VQLVGCNPQTVAAYVARRDAGLDARIIPSGVYGSAQGWD